MKFYEALEWLRSDLDDDNELNYFFTDLQLSNFLVRGLQETNDRLLTAHRYQFIILNQYKDVYDLNPDFIKAIHIYDVKNQTDIDWNEYASMFAVGNKTTAVAYTGYLRRMKIDDARQKIYFSELPDSDNDYAYTISSNDLSSTPSTITITDTTNSFSHWFDPTWVIIEGYALKVVNIDDIDSTTKKLYISEQIALTNDDVGINVNSGELKEVSIVIDYYYQPAKDTYLYKATGTITLEAGETTLDVSVSPLSNGINVGDYIFIEDYGAREVIGIDDNNLTVTIEEEFSDVLPATTTMYRYYVIKAQEDLPVPVEIQDIVLQYAKYYAMLRSADLNANNQLAIVTRLIEDEKHRQLQEIVNNRMLDVQKDVWGGLYG